jgi:hypothetical protein
MDDRDLLKAILPHRIWVLPVARADVQTQPTRLERLHGLKGMDFAYSTCHYLQKSPWAISIEFSAAASSLGKPDGPKRSSNRMHRYLAGKSAPKRGPRGKFRFDLVGAICAHPRGALVERSLNRRIYRMVDPDTSLRELRALLFELPDVVRVDLFDMHPARNRDHAAWRRLPPDGCAAPPGLVTLVVNASRQSWNPREAEAPLVFALFETLVGLWAEARLNFDGARMAALLELITLTQDLVLADETFPYVLPPFLAFLSFDGPDRPPVKAR